MMKKIRVDDGRRAGHRCTKRRLKIVSGRELAALEINSRSLDEIAQVRQADAWRFYIESLRGLLRAPANVEEEAAAVFEAYRAMIRSAVPKGEGLVSLDPLPKMLIQIDAATIELV